MLKKFIAGHRDTKNIDWAAISQKFDGRNKKQCRDRWLNYLRPGIVKGQWTKEEGELIKDMHQALGPKYVSCCY
jgi:Myb-like DNA-binding domain